MKPGAQRSRDARRNRFEADLDAGIRDLFRRCPTLCGFSLRDTSSLLREGLDLRHAGDLFITEVSVYPQSDLEASPEICLEIMTLLRRLIDDSPQDCAQLCERTYARTFH